MEAYKQKVRFGMYEIDYSRVIKLAILEAQAPRKVDRVFAWQIHKWVGRCPLVAVYSVVWKDPGCRRVKSLEERVMVVENHTGIKWWNVRIVPWI